MRITSQIESRAESQIESLTESLTERLDAWRELEFSDELLADARFYLLDWLGSTFAGQATEPGQILLAHAGKQPAGNCNIIGLNARSSAETAALVNGGLSHIVEMDDLDRGSVVHPAAVVIPAALAVAQREGRTGLDFLKAIVVGYEVAIRIGEAVGKQHYYYFHNTGTCGVFGAAAAAGWLLGLNPQQMVWALGNAGTQAAGLWQFNADGDMSKHLHTGRAAAGGLLAADLAKMGFTGARQILEGERGFFAATAPDADPTRILAGLEANPTQFKISGVSIKPHASCRHTHPAVDAAIHLHHQVASGNIGFDKIDEVVVETYQATLDLCDNPTPQTPYAAKFSIHYCTASALLRGQAGLADFAPEMIMQADIRNILPRIKAMVAPDIEQRYPHEWPVRVHVTLIDGTVLSRTVDHPKGDPANQLTLDELQNKFRYLTTYGGYGDEAERWVGWVDALGDEPICCK